MARRGVISRLRSLSAGVVPRLVLRLRHARLAARLCALKIRERSAEGKSTTPSKAESSVVTVLALTPYRFRGDLESLAAIPGFRVLEMPHLWQLWMYFNFYPRGTKNDVVFHPEPGSLSERRQLEYRAFLREFLTEIYRQFGVSCVIGADVRYREDIDIGVVSIELGVPYIVLHRECMMVTKTIYDLVREKLSLWRRFLGSGVIVHNEISRQNFVDSKFVSSDKIEVLGSARMDGFLRRIACEGQRAPRRPLVVLFTFIHEQFELPRSVFDQAHVAVARIAQRHPDVDVVVKPKREVINKTAWSRYYAEALADAGIDPATLPNLRIMVDANAHDLIIAASSVIAINSTTVLEAGVAGVPVVVPCFREIQGEAYRESVHFRDDLDAFDVPDDSHEMIAMIENHLKGTEVSETSMRRRRMLFERYVSPMSGEAAERYRATVLKHVEATGAPFAPTLLRYLHRSLALRGGENFVSSR
jgi:hypothetical protein